MMLKLNPEETQVLKYSEVIGLKDCHTRNQEVALMLKMQWKTKSSISKEYVG